MDDLESEWRRKGATVSHKTAQKEFGLTWEDIVRAIRAGKLHCQQQSMHGNPGFGFSGERWKRWSAKGMAPAT